MAARSIWSGAVSFGLVSIPVRMFSATESKELRFHFVDRNDLAPVGYDKVRKDTGEHVDPDEIVRAYEIEKGRCADEVRKPESLDGDLAFREVELRKAEVEMAKTLVENLSAEFDPAKYTDTYRAELMELLEQKAEGVPRPEPAEAGGEVIDLMQALRESVKRTQRKRATRPKAKKAS